MTTPVTLESAGITAGSPFLATPEEAAALEETARQQAAAREAEIHAALDGVFRCNRCGGDAAFRPSGLCIDCEFDAAAEARAARRAKKTAGRP